MMPYTAHKNLETYDIRLKLIGGEPVQAMVTPKPIFNPAGLRDVNDIPSSFRRRIEKTVDNVDNVDNSDTSTHERSSARARRMVRDYILCNPDMKCFLTLTFSPDEIDRYSYNDVISKLNTWLDNRVRRHGLKYILIPEFHKDGAIHFHGLCNNTMNTVFSGLYWKNGKVTSEPSRKLIYNIYDFEYGHTTLMEISGKNATAQISNYIMKYITKNCQKVGGRYYLHGGSLAKPEYAYFRSGDLQNSTAFTALNPTCEFEVYQGHTLRIYYDSELLTLLGMLKGGDNLEG